MASYHMPNAVHYTIYRVNRTRLKINTSLTIIFVKERWGIIKVNACVRIYLSDYKLLQDGSVKVLHTYVMKY